MFSPMGKKKILLEKRLSSATRSTSPKDRTVGKVTHDDDGGGSKERNKLAEKSLTDLVASMSNLHLSLSSSSTIGVVMNRILEATIRYRPEKDYATLKAFQSKRIEYGHFRSYLHTAFWLSFDDFEFHVLTSYFDPMHYNAINGYDFMIAFIKLGTIRKDRVAEELRKQQEAHRVKAAEEQHRRTSEQQRKMELAADFTFSEDVRRGAVEKLHQAAFNFDPNHPSSGSTEAFNVDSMSSVVFKEMLKLTFNLKVDRAELGAILREFKADFAADNTTIPSAEFLRYFMRIGIDLRDKALKDQRQKQLSISRQMEEMRLRKKKEAEDKMQQEVDFNFSERDEISVKQKLRTSSMKYDRYAAGAVALDGFDCDGLNAGQFKDLVRRVFGLGLTSGELGWIMRKYDLKNNGKVVCRNFLNDFLKLGNEGRYAQHLEQLKRQRDTVLKVEADHLKKVDSVLNSEKVSIAATFVEKDLNSALAKLTEASIKFDKMRGGSLISFEPSFLTPLEFKRAVRRTFNLNFNAEEMGALIQYFDIDQSRTINCQKFLTTFTLLGSSKKDEIKSEQLNKQRDLWRRQRDEEEAKVLDLSSKVLYEVDLEFSEDEKFAALGKLTTAATKYDPSHAAAVGLDAFERKTMSPGEFKEIVRRTFHLKLLPREVGAIFDFFSNKDAEAAAATGADVIDCGEFLRYFIHLGITERAKVKSGQIERQRRENREREEEHERKVLALANRNSFEVDANFSEADSATIMQKLRTASEGFDKNHPAAPSLEAFDTAYLTPGIFRENLKRVFNVIASPKEIGYLLTLYDKEGRGLIDSKEFMLKFLGMGKKLRDDKRKLFLEEQRQSIKEAALEEERKLNAAFEKAELKVDYDFSQEHLQSSLAKFTDASFFYDKTNPSAPSLEGFLGGPIKPGAFRELLRRIFNVNLDGKELGACVKRFKHERLKNMVDGKVFIIEFMRLGFEAKSAAKMLNIQKQRQFVTQQRQESEFKLKRAQQKNEIVLNDVAFDKVDEERSLHKLISASALYDKNSPGCVALDAFDSAFLTPGMFREVAKRTFNVVFSDKELAAMINLYNDGHGNLDNQRFLVAFIKFGSDERERIHSIQLEKQRNDDILRRSEHERKMKELQDKVLIDIKYDYSQAERDAAFEKLKIQAKKYDKNHPGAMSLDGFEQKQLEPHVFREMIKRTFGVLFTPGEFGACMDHFDPKRSGFISSKKFLRYFLKLGIVERENTYKEDLEKLRSDAIMREREHTEKVAAQWAKMELNLSSQFTEEQLHSALEKLAIAALHFDPASPGPMGLTAFEAKTLSPSIFREMLRRSFNMKVSDGELAALINKFDHDKSNSVNCREFMLHFTKIGFERKSERHAAQLEKQRRMNEDAEKEFSANKMASDMKHELKIDMKFAPDDFNSALEKIRQIASNYDRSHPSAPSLAGFLGTAMKPKEFKFMLLRTFNLTLTDKELGALISVFGMKSDTASGTDNKTTGLDVVRIDNNEFLKYFNKIQREEQSRRYRERITRERELIKQEKDRLEALDRKKQADCLNSLVHSAEDEPMFLDKIRQAAENYAVDSALYVDGIQGFKGPNLPPDKFRELFAKVFGIKLSFPEVGILLHIIDIGGSVTVGGTRFLNWFYRVSRHAEKFLLEETNEPLSMEILRSSALLYSRGGGQSIRDDDDADSLSLSETKRSKMKPSLSSIPAAIRSPAVMKSRGNAISRSDSDKYEYFKEYNNKYEYDESKIPDNNVPYEVHNSQSFVQSTLSKKWFLPSITSLTPDNNYDETVHDFNGHAGLSSSEDQNGDSVRMHLASLFSADLEPKQTDKSTIGSSSLSSRGNFGASLQSINSQISTLTEPESQLLLMQKGTSSLRENSKSVSTPSKRVATEALTMIPGQIRLKLVNKSSNSSSHDQHSVFFSDLFESETPSINFPDRFPTSTSQKTYPPLEQIRKLNHDLKESPMALTQKKFQSRGRRRDDKRVIDERVREVLSIPVIMNSTRPHPKAAAGLTGSPLKASSADHNIIKEGEDSISSSNFFFPAVLMASNPD